MDGKVLGPEAYDYAMTNPQNTSVSKDPLEMGVFYYQNRVVRIVSEENPVFGGFGLGRKLRNPLNPLMF